MSAEAKRDWPNHIANLISNTEEVMTLLRLHASLIGGKRGRPKVVEGLDLEVLSKGALVLLVACWEAYVEDLATNAFDFLLAAAVEHTTFPSKVLARASRNLVEDEDRTKVWQLAGSGWKLVLKRHRQEVLDRYAGRLNTPRQTQVDALFADLIGLRGLSKQWKWRGTSNQSAIDRLERLVTLRGEISHRVTASRSVHRRYVESSTDLVQRLAAISSNAVREFLIGRVGSKPWVSMQYGETR